MLYSCFATGTCASPDYEQFGFFSLPATICVNKLREIGLLCHVVRMMAQLIYFSCKTLCQGTVCEV